MTGPDCDDCHDLVKKNKPCNDLVCVFDGCFNWNIWKIGGNFHQNFLYMTKARESVGERGEL
jgi:hypothetical protein